nr:hypothetical protein [Microvirga aerophila]
MPESHERAGPVMRGRASLKPNQARRQCAEEPRHLAAAQRLAQDDLAIPVDAVDLEDVLCDIKTDCGNLRHDNTIFSYGGGAKPLILQQPVSASLPV